MPAGGRITNERMGQSVITMEELERMEIETNSITDRCLGCCDGYGTPLPGHIGYPGGGITTGVTRGRRGPTGSKPSHPPPQRNKPPSLCPTAMPPRGPGDPGQCGITGRAANPRICAATWAAGLPWAPMGAALARKTEQQGQSVWTTGRTRMCIFYGRGAVY
uniref:Uncharacterized protein n=1 Tax=Xenopus tropicalis TaxID=8364 RepID=A0A1B8XXJ0_XENTR